MIAYWERGLEWMGEGLQLAICPSFTGPTSLQALDVSGRSNHGTLTNMDRNTAWATSGGKGALSFNGQADDVRLAPSWSLNVQNPSVSIWVYMRTQNSNIKGILDNEHNSSQGYVIQSEDAATNRRFYFAWHDGTSFRGNGVTNTVTIPLEKWSHICYVKNGATISGYLDGRQVYSITAVNGNIFYATPPKQVFIGGTVSPGGRQWNGDIDDLRLYNRPPTPQEVWQLYERDRGGGMLYQPPKRRSVFIAAGFRAYWHRRQSYIIGGGLR